MGTHCTIPPPFHLPACPLPSFTIQTPCPPPNTIGPPVPEQAYYAGMPCLNTPVAAWQQHPLPLRRHGDELQRLPGGGGFYTARGRVDDTMNLGKHVHRPWTCQTKFLLQVLLTSLRHWRSKHLSLFGHCGRGHQGGQRGV